MQRTPFESIEDFVQIKQNCVFCHTPLRVILTNFVGLGKNGIPLLNAPIQDGYSNVVFNVGKTTAHYSVEATGTIDIRTNALVFDMEAFEYNLLACDYMEGEPRACEVFLDTKPHIQIYCPSKTCGMDYTISSEVFLISCSRIKNRSIFAWTINGFRLWMEAFVIGNLWIQNDWIGGSTNIYSRNNPNADAISVPLISFEGMSKSKLLTRVQTLVTFS